LFSVICNNANYNHGTDASGNNANGTANNYEDEDHDADNNYDSDNDKKPVARNDDDEYFDAEEDDNSNLSDDENIVAKMNNYVLEDGQQPCGRMSASIPNATAALFENDDNYDNHDDDINLILPADHSLDNNNFIPGEPQEPNYAGMTDSKAADARDLSDCFCLLPMLSFHPKLSKFWSMSV
jgi:hypothetical protein